MTHEVRPVRRAIRNLDWDLLWEKFGIATILVVVWILAAIGTPRFAIPDNLSSVLRQSAFVGVASVGMTIAIIAGTGRICSGSQCLDRGHDCAPHWCPPSLHRGSRRWWDRRIAQWRFSSSSTHPSLYRDAWYDVPR